MANSDHELDQADLDKAVAFQDVRAKKIEGAIANGRGRSPERKTIGFYESKINELTNLWNIFDEGDTKLQELAFDLNETRKCAYIIGDKFAEIEAKYQDYMAELLDGLKEKISLMQGQNVQDNQHTMNTYQHTPLPRINLPKFSGNYNEWRSFQDLFVSVVHNNTKLQPVQKLHYLKGCLSGEAERLLLHIPITNEDYTPAWEKLKMRYDNKRLLINTQLKKLTNPTRCNNETTKGLRMLLDSTDECLQQLKALGVHVEQWDTLLLHILIQGLPINTIKSWEEELGDSQELPSLKQFMDFIQNRARVLESVSSTVTERVPGHHTTKALHIRNEANTATCPACGEKHYVGTCKIFKEMNTTQRLNCISKSARCYNCLSSKHKANQCGTKNTCRICSRKHHTMLHTSEGSKFQNTRLVVEKQRSIPCSSRVEELNSLNGTENTHQSAQTFLNRKERSVLLSTIRVITQDRYGNDMNLRCLLDSGSQASFITSSTYKRLGIKGRPNIVEICGLNQNKTAWSNHQLKIELASWQDRRKAIDVELLVIDKITDFLPFKTIKPREDWKHLQGLTLADPTYWKSGPIDILLGADIYAEIIQGGLVKGLSDAPVAINTLFGWILLGKGPREQEVQVFLATTDSMQKLNQNLMRFWESEEIIKPPLQSPEDTQCELHFRETHKRLRNGQYEVRLPFVKEPNLGASRETTMRRFEHLRRKFNKNPQLEAEYSKCMNEYLSLGHMKPISNLVVKNNEGYYIPHHAVYKESSTTKLRVVFDASAKTSNGNSLNNQLLTGPTIQPKLSATLLKWRKYKVAITADIEKMYRMIQIHPDDRKYQKIIWINPETKEIQDYELTTITFGVTSAAYLAIRTVLQLAQDEEKRWPLASRATKTDFYVDDLLSGADTVQEAKELQHQCINMLKEGNFNLRKWASNYKEMLSELPLEHVETKEFLQFDEQESIKTLGIKWIPQIDQFTFKVKEWATTDTPTKRKMLSEIASLYDPLGWIAPVIVVAKVLIQRLWISGCPWDTKVDPQTARTWYKFKTELKQLETLRIPRWIGYQTNSKNIQIHGFSDASMLAYAAVVYLRVQTETGQILVHMLTSKTRVAPTKPVTIPRLELNGATLLARLIQTTVQEMQLGTIPITAWTDSTIALQWIKSSPIKWKTYVANRVTEIQDSVPPECWRHVPTNQNPADMASRGVTIHELLQSKMWWYGPDWLVKPENEWPKIPNSTSPPQLELRKMVTVMINTSTDSEIFHRFSSFGKLQRIIALLRRFTHNARKANVDKKWGQITMQELQEATKVICKLIQKTCFHEEYFKLFNKQNISNTSKLLSLTPILDNEGVMRVGGRLEQAIIPYSRKHPIILPANHIVTNLIIDEIHKYTLHGGRNLVVNTSRNWCWIVNAQNIVAKRINNCITCIRQRQKLMSQRMGELPAVRIHISKPFTNVGIDYAGPIQLKTSPHRKSSQYKGYFCVFVCMATKAIHLELVSDLTATAFIAALKRFIARRGLCVNIYSDCGTNFKGAKNILEKELRKAIDDALCETAKSTMLQSTINWHFNPPSAPHFGGLWEASVKSVKYHLKRIIGKSIYTYEEYTTLLTQVEACLNSRPLCPIGNSTEDLQVLTPGHFLIGQSLNAMPEPNLLETGIPPTRRWKHVQFMMQQFWNKWSKDYLNTLQQRRKWCQTSSNLKEGEIVLIKEDNTSPSVWPLARVVQTFPGKDHLTRVVEVRTATNVFKRPITKICPLPVQSIEEPGQKIDEAAN